MRRRLWGKKEKGREERKDIEHFLKKFNLFDC